MALDAIDSAIAAVIAPMSGVMAQEGAAGDVQEAIRDRDGYLRVHHNKRAAAKCCPYLTLMSVSTRRSAKK
jgi:hypothetical protein